jgi:hypothetical protein
LRRSSWRPGRAPCAQRMGSRQRPDFSRSR